MTQTVGRPSVRGTVRVDPLQTLLREHAAVRRNPSRAEIWEDTLTNREALLAPSGTLATWGSATGTGRIPQDTYVVAERWAMEACDWNYSACHPMDPKVFDRLWGDAMRVLQAKEKLYVTDRVIGADSACALPVRTVTDSPLTALFTDTMFRPVSTEGQRSVFAQKPCTLLVLPHDRVHTPPYEGVLRTSGGKIIDMVVVMDFEHMRGLIYGTSYLGSVKKLLFTMMNVLLPEEGILPLHCAANMGKQGDTALFLGLSGTGKTTLSTDSRRQMIGDDEHLWSDCGIANMEGGCYAKLLGLRPEKEPEIYAAVFRRDVIIENALMYPNGSLDLDDARLTENSRASYPLGHLPRVVRSGCGPHPQTILFLTADARGVLPPIAKLSASQALLWFLMGYTSKLAGTEAGIVKPQATFSRFFGGPFMLRKPMDYLTLFAEKIREHQTSVYLVNTGWSGGVGKRMDIAVTRRLVSAALTGEFRGVPMWEDTRFHLSVPYTCPGVDDALLHPRKTWQDGSAYDCAADALAQEFAAVFTKEFAGRVAPEIAAECPGGGV